MLIRLALTIILASSLVGALATHAADPPRTSLQIAETTGVGGVRPTTSDELVGAWELSVDPGLQYPRQYIVITKDHRIGWVAATTEVNGATRSKLTGIITVGKSNSGVVDAWHDWLVLPSRSGLGLQIKVTGHGFYSFVGYTRPSSVDSIFGMLELKAGDLTMAQFYPDMNTLTPPPVRLRRMHRLPD